jgi:Protein of unknown function (DUF2490)
MTARRRWCVLWLMCVLAGPSTAAAQVKKQFWVTGVVDWLATDRLTYEIELEPKTNPATLEATPEIEYTVTAWADVLAEVALESQADAGTTATPRFGLELHILSRLFQAHALRGAEREKPPLRRVVANTLLRVEHSNSTWRFRDRFQLAYPLNRRKTTDNGAVYLTGDSELFIPLDRTSGEALVSQVRLRSGIGYRQSFAWRFEALYIWNGSRHSDSGPLVPESHAIDIRINRNF